MERANSRMAGLERGRLAFRVVAGFLGLLCWLGGTGSALAAGTFVVDGANPGCSDTAPGAGTEGNPPYCTISAAAEARGGPGTTILVKPGVYREQVTVRASGAAGNPFVFRTLGPGVVVDGMFQIGARDWVTIDGFIITYGIYVNASTGCSGNLTLTHNTVNFGAISVSGFTNVLIGSNVVSDSREDGIILNRCGSATIQDNEVFRTHRDGIRLDRAPNSLIQRNTVHDNDDTGIRITSSTNTLLLQNRSWRNGSHGFHLSQSTGTRHVGDVAWGNAGRGFSLGWEATDTQIFNSIGANNGLATGEYDLFVESTAASGFVSNSNIFWNSTGLAPIKYAGTTHTTLAAFTAATGHDAQSLQADPRFLHPEVGDFRLLPGSPATDAADSSVAGWPPTDAAGQARVDDPATPDTGTGPVPYADRGALEFPPTGPPLAALTVTPASGTVPLAVTAEASRSFDPDGTVVAYRFDFGDGTVVGPQAEAAASHTYQQAGTFTVTVTVTDNEGGDGSATTPVTVAPPNQPPVAALTVAPASGTEPLAVIADASGSSDPDGTIVSYRFDFGDFSPGRVVGPQAEATASHRYGTGTWTVTVTVTDNLGATGAASATVTVVGPIRNWVSNGSFEGGTGGWTAYGGASLQRVAGGFDGAFALEVRGPASTTEFGINDSPNWIASTSAAGTRYRFSAWVRAAAHTGQVRLRVREYLNGTQVGGTTRSAPLALTPAWQLLLVDHVTQAAGSTLDFQVFAMPLAPGAVFQVDHIAIRIVPSTTNQPPNGVIDRPAGDVTIVAGQSVEFTSTGSDADNTLPLTYLWSFAGGEPQQTGNEDPGPVLFRTPGTYTVTLTAIDSLGLADSTPDRRVITVHASPDGTIDSPAGDVTIVAGESVLFAGTGSDPEAHLPLAFQWDFRGGAPNVTVEDPGPVPFSTPGTYFVTFTVTNSLGVADPTPASRLIRVLASQAPNGVIDTPLTDVTITAGQSVSFSGTGSDLDGNLPLTYRWDFGGGAAPQQVEDPGPVVFSAPGSYTVRFTVTDSSGVSDPTPDRRVIVVADPSGASNLVRNPSFESDTSGWSGYGGATTQRVLGGQEGAFALEVRGPASTALFGINDGPNWVGSTGAAGTRYRFSAWVRAAAHTGQAVLRVREYNGGVQIGPTVRSAPVTLSPAWQMLTLDLVAGAAGSTLDFQVLDYVPATTGEVFWVDNIAIRVVP